MQFYLFRHADKERSISADPPLSLRGLKQAQKLRELVETGKIIRPMTLISSPKIRAQQTLQPLAQWMNVRLQTSPDYLERQHHESGLDFQTRVKTSISKIEKQNGIAFVVTHFDWIEEFLDSISCDTDFNEGAFRSWSPAQFMDFEIKDGLWHLNHFGSVQI